MNPRPPDAVRDLSTPHGPGRAHVWMPATGDVTRDVAGSLVVSHGAGGSKAWSADLAALTALADGPRPWQVVLVEQPWRVAGRKVASPPAQLDACWLAMLPALAAEPADLPRPMVVGGRSAGARVACRTASAVGADAVLALAFPLHPPGRPEKTRVGELLGVDRPMLVVQGERDPFGTPEEVRAAAPDVPLVAVAGGHGFSRDPVDVVAAVRTWLAPGARISAGAGSEEGAARGVSR